MTAKRIIPCLDVRNGRVVKGTHFVDLRDIGDPSDLAARYCDDGADEIVVLDVSATLEARLAALLLVERIAARLDVPLTVGGGLRTLEDVTRLLNAGADKVAINSAALANPALISESAARYGSQCIVVAIDARRSGDGYAVMARSATVAVSVGAREWACRAAALGAGELLVTSIDRDGTLAGYDLELLRSIGEAVDVPVIASGGASDAGSFTEAFAAGADAALAASLFHDGTLTIGEIKSACRASGVLVRS
jgi:cyclase